MAKYLEKRRRRWYATLDVPVALRDMFGGKSKLRRSLATESLTEAERRVMPVIAAWKAAFTRARHEDPLERDIEFWRGVLADTGLGDFEREIAMDSILDQAEKLERQQGDEKAKVWFGRASGRSIDLKSISDEWLASGRWEAKTVTMHRQAMTLLQAKHPTAETVDRKAAADFVRLVLAPGRTPATVNRMLSTYSTLWRWMSDQGVLPSSHQNPWSRQRMSTQTGRASIRDRRRPFTDKEALALIRGVDKAAERHPADPLTVRLLAITGMRISEVCGLRVEDVEVVPGESPVAWLHVTEGKRQASVRKVPVVVPEVVQWIKDRLALLETTGATAFFPEYRPTRYGKQSAALSKRLARILRTITTDPRAVAAHSWRHRARSQLERAGIRPSIADTLMGHERPGVGMGTYYAPTDAELIEGIKALTLPAESADMENEPA